MLAVAPAARGRGVGEALATWCVDRARADGCHAVVLSTLPVMHAAHRLYQRLGFVRTPERDWYPGAGGPADHLPARALTAAQRRARNRARSTTTRVTCPWPSTVAVGGLGHHVEPQQPSVDVHQVGADRRPRRRPRDARWWASSTRVPTVDSASASRPARAAHAWPARTRPSSRGVASTSRSPLPRARAVSSGVTWCCTRAWAPGCTVTRLAYGAWWTTNPGATSAGTPATGDHGACAARRELEPPRYCGQCRRRMVVQVMPRGWSARCVEHGTRTG